MIYYMWNLIPGLIGNVESVRYSSGLNATGGPSAKNDGSIVGLNIIFSMNQHTIEGQTLTFTVGLSLNYRGITCT